jgi:hypothetical protein
VTRLSGYPTSSNRASSFHLYWLPGVELAEVSVTLQVTAQPTVDDLHFWALQASFAGPGGVLGAGHIGLQWHSSYPSHGAVNWGGYYSDGSILNGTRSELPSILDNPHTRDFPWSPGVDYRLRIHSDRPGWWVGEVTNPATAVTTTVRELNGGGDRLVVPMVWSEIFARCDASPSAAVWSRPTGVMLDGSAWHPDSYRVTYQREEDGGCSNTDVAVLPHGVGQITGVARVTPAGAVIPAI